MNKFKNFLNSEIELIFQEIVSIRRHIHQNPELSFAEFQTADLIRQYLKKNSIQFEIVSQTGTIGFIGSGSPCVALRADIDALPIKEETDLEFSSKVEGVMHACGHDMHTAILLGTATVLKKLEPKITGTVKLIFQPGEEKLPGGAIKLINEGVLDAPKPDFVFGQHVDPEKEAGIISISEGTILASADELYITLTGKQSHAAQPHLGNDLILAASSLIINLQSIVSRNRNPLLPGVLSITAINGGSATNILPAKVEIMGTLRSFDQTWRKNALNLIETYIKNISNIYNCNCNFNPALGYPPLNNDFKAVQHIRKIAIDYLGAKKVQLFEPKMWAEDFAYYSQKVPSAFWFLGVKPKETKQIIPLHNSHFSPDEEAIKTGIAIMTLSAYEYLRTKD